MNDSPSITAVHRERMSTGASAAFPSGLPLARIMRGKTTWGTVARAPTAKAGVRESPRVRRKNTNGATISPRCEVIVLTLRHTSIARRGQHRLPPVSASERRASGVETYVMA